MEEQKAEGLQLNTITDSLGVVGSAMSNDSADEPLKVTDSLEPFLKELILATNELVNQFEEISILQKDMMVDDKRRTAEELSELKAKEDKTTTTTSPLVEPLENLSTAIADLTKLIEETDFGGGLSLVDAAATGLAAVGTAAVAGAGALIAGGAGALAATGAMVFGADQFMKETYNESNESLDRLKSEYGMKAIKNESGFTEGYEINGTKYKASELPEQYQTLLDAYGPGADPRSGTTKKALESIQKNPATFSALRSTPETPSTSSTVPTPETPPTPSTIPTPIKPEPTAIATGESGILSKTEDVEKAESTIEVANPIMMGQTNNQTAKKLESKLYDFGAREVDDVPNPNYSGGILETELFP